MAILESTDIPHPAIEALFTIDEETGMTGAMGLQGGMLDGEMLLMLILFALLKQTKISVI